MLPKRTANETIFPHPLVYLTRVIYAGLAKKLGEPPRAGLLRGLLA